MGHAISRMRPFVLVFVFFAADLFERGLVFSVKYRLIDVRPELF